VDLAGSGPGRRRWNVDSIGSEAGFLLELQSSFGLKMEHTAGTFGGGFVNLFRSIAARGFALLGQG
jgi:hypothetical protein